MVIIFEIIIIIIACFLVDLFTYKFIRHLDKKERAKLAEKETEYLKGLIKEMNEEPQKQEELEESDIDLFDL